MDELASLVTRARAGDAIAYGQLVGRFQDMAYGYAYAILGDWSLAQDAAQEAFIEAYRSLPSLRQPYAFPGWLKRIVFKQCDRLTRNRRIVSAPIEAAIEVPTRTPGPAETVETRESRETVLRAVQDLPAHERQVTALYYIDGYSQREIAAFLEVPASTVKSRLYASRQRLKERMVDMVRDSLQSNALPESFTEETIRQAIARAAELNKERQYGEAEALLRDILGKAPGHPAALKELNRTLMHGWVYGRARWDRLPELVEHGRAILASGSDDEYVYHEIARTLLAVPAIPQAVAFIQQWMEAKGPNLERLGMLAWATGCLAKYDEAERLWEQQAAMIPEAEPAQVLGPVPFACATLVDCFAAAGEATRAQRVARTGWKTCYPLGEIPIGDIREGFRGDFEWLQIHH